MPTIGRLKTTLILLLLWPVVVTGYHGFSGEAAAADNAGVLKSRILKTGTKAPVFKADQLGGGEFDLQTQIGEKPVVIFFWSFFCAPCREEMPILREVQEDLGKDTVQFISLNLDGVKLGKAIEKYMEDSGFDFITVFDELVGLEYKIADAYGVSGTPTLYLIDPEGKVAFSIVGRVEPEELKEAVLRSTGKTP
jgi:thiol-disulfide isomerase/thioredoxin